MMIYFSSYFLQKNDDNDDGAFTKEKYCQVYITVPIPEIMDK